MLTLSYYFEAPFVRLSYCGIEKYKLLFTQYTISVSRSLFVNVLPMLQNI